MAYDEKLAARIRALLASRDDVEERLMFGGICFMVAGSMCCGLTKSDFVVKVGADAFARLVQEPHARPMDFTGTPSRSMLYVEPAGLRTPAMLAKWVQRGLDFVTSDPKPRKRPSARRRT